MSQKDNKNNAKKPPKKAPKKAPVKHKLPTKEKQLLKNVLSTANPVDGLRHTFEIIQESMGCYVLMGYSFDGHPITAVVANSPQEYDALYSRVALFLQSRPPGIIGPPPMDSHPDPE